jgi:ribosome biogenesis GTPase
VVEVAAGLCRVAFPDRTLTCSVRGTLAHHDTGFTNVVAVGDRVRVSRGGGEEGIVEAVMPRRSVLARPDPFYSHLQQVVVANLEQVLIVASWQEPPLWAELIDRYLIAAQRSRISALICVNKVDLAEDAAPVRAQLQPYADLGHRLLFTSAVTGKGVGRLREALRGRTTALVGLSGVGKSSLLAALQPGLVLRTAEVSGHSGQGRHTTSQITMLPLAIGGFVVDTPGIREFGLGGLTRAELMRFYREFVPFADRCRFSNCSHAHEPGCAVKAAVTRGCLSPMRYHSYRRIYESLPA